MAAKKKPVTGGVDTHKDFHHAAAVDQAGRLLGDQQFAADAAGYRLLLAWLGTFGPVVKVGVEGTGSYGAGLARYLAEQHIEVVEVDRPDRKTRRRKGKSDPIDAIAAAQATVSGRASGAPKARTGPVEAIRAMQVARRGAVKARTAALNQLDGLIISAPEQLRAQLRKLSGAKLLAACMNLPVDEKHLSHPVHATSTALRALAARIHNLTAEIDQVDKCLRPVVAKAAPRVSALFGVGPEVASRLLATAGDNPDRLRSEAALAHLCGVAPLPVSSGRKDRHRLNRGGDRSANCALYTVVLSRLRHDPRTRAYMDRRTKDGLSKKEIIRCLKRYVVREVHTALLADFAVLNA
jgi:transposase